ncbi:hypothetical protein [Stenotrophomonas sp. PS02289]|uniref:hypothetical protein n=1 Tax=Stenotrophomonas sp. PS02289 TaxID=2991422 RepID=UPI00249C09FF|nr:hypothetical protein [Stenotrophomonas sp. PS02289]
MQDERQLDAAPMNSPYSPPQAALPDTSPAMPRLPALLHRLIAILIAAFCSVHFMSMWIMVLRQVSEYGLELMPLSYIAKLMVMPLTLALAGVFLAFGRRVSVLLFAAYLAMYAIRFGAGNGYHWPTLLLAIGFLGYSAWRWKTGALTGWPQRRAG